MLKSLVVEAGGGGACRVFHWRVPLISGAITQRICRVVNDSFISPRPNSMEIRWGFFPLSVSVSLPAVPFTGCFDRVSL